MSGSHLKSFLDFENSSPTSIGNVQRPLSRFWKPLGLGWIWRIRNSCWNSTLAIITSFDSFTTHQSRQLNLRMRQAQECQHILIGGLLLCCSSRYPPSFLFLFRAVLEVKTLLPSYTAPFTPHTTLFQNFSPLRKMVILTSHFLQRWLWRIGGGEPACARRVY